MALLEGPIATLLGVSRGPVHRALELLAREGLVHRFNGWGYQVGATSSEVEPIRVNLLTLNLDVSGGIQDYAQRAPGKGYMARSQIGSSRAAPSAEDHNYLVRRWVEFLNA